MLSEQQVAEALPEKGWLRQYVEWASQCTDAPKAYHIGTGLSLLSMAAPIDYNVPFGAGPIRCNVFILLVGDSRVARKTQAIKLGASVLRNGMEEFVGEEPGSPQGLEASIRKKPKQILFYEEFGEFLAKAEEGFMLPMKTLLTRVYDCSPQGKALSKEVRGEVKNPRVSVLGGSAPEYLERHTEPTDWTGGFFSRFLVFNASRERTYTIPPGAPGMDDLSTGLMTIKNRPIGPCRGLEPGRVRAMWDTYYQQQEGMAAQAARATSGALSGAPTNALKIAGLLALDDGTALMNMPWYIQEKTLGAAIKIVGMHSQSVLEIGDTLAESRDMRDRRTVLRLIDTVEPTPLSMIVNKSKLLSRRVTEILSSLLTEQTINAVNVNQFTRNLAPGEVDTRPQAVTRVITLSTTVRTLDDDLYDADMRKVAEGKSVVLGQLAYSTDESIAPPSVSKELKVVKPTSSAGDAGDNGGNGKIDRTNGTAQPELGLLPMLQLQVGPSATVTDATSAPLPLLTFVPDDAVGNSANGPNG